MEPRIQEMLSFRDMRAIEYKNALLSTDGVLINQALRGVAAFYYKDASEKAIDDFISAELYDEVAESKGDDTLNDIVFLVEVLLDVFRYSKKPSQINRRLKLFCLKNIILLNDPAFAQHKAAYLADLFRFFLFFHPCSEDYIDSLVWENDQCSYKGESIELAQQVKAFFDFIISQRDSFTSLDGFTGEQLALSHDITRELLESMFTAKGPVTFAPIQDGAVALSDIFSNPQRFFELYQRDREQFFRILEDNIDHYIVSNWDDDKSGQASVYYGPSRNDAVEAYFTRPGRISRKRKYLTEYFVDLYVFYMLRDPAELERGISYFSANPAMQLKVTAVLFSHPFYNGEARLKMIKAGVDELLPPGFWTEKINRMKNSVQ